MARYKSDIDYVQYALDIAYDDRYYYAHSSDVFAFSCSTLVGHALYVCKYVKTDPKPRDGHAIGGSVLDGYLKEAGFERYTWEKAGGMKPGDVLIVHPYHVAFHIRDGMMVAANGGGDMVDKRPEAITVYPYTAYGTPKYVWRPTVIHKVVKMTKTEKAIQQMEAWAKDDSHGYSQFNRWGPDYDCSSAVIQAWENAGVMVKSGGATYTGNMRAVFINKGFSDVTGKVNLDTGAGLQRGDVLLNSQYHVAMYCGDGKEVEASQDENGGIGGKTGDQTGKEFLIRSYRNYPWNYVLRYKDSGTGSKEIYMLTFKKIKYGDKNKYVKVFQAMLRGRGFIDKKKKKETGDGTIKLDSEWGNSTQRAWAYFQEKAGLPVKDYCDEVRWKKLLYNL